VKRGGDAWVISQVFFDDALNASIFESHPDYVKYGQPDTTNQTDGIIGDNPGPYLLSTERMKDGIMLAWKKVVLRNSLQDAPCSP
jgi:hypothetical protein